MFVDPPGLSALTDPAEPILVPATNPIQVEALRSLQRECCMTCLVAVVNDVNGYQTYQAMSAGATCVFNLAIPVDKQIDSLHAVFTAYTHAAERPLHAVSAAPAIPKSPVEQTRNMDDESRLLISLLCGPHTICSIAKQFYCSERSMYRRVRGIYSFFGVSSRNELRSAIAVSHVETQRVS
jgi:DNA-binding NarL/FixJ family response regulator